MAEWTPLQYAQDKNGDTVKVTGLKTATIARAGFELQIDSDRRYAYVKVTEVSSGVSKWKFKVYNDGALKASWEFTDTGEKEIDVYASYSGAVDQLVLEIDAAADTDYIVVDWVVVGCKQKVSSVEDDVLSLQVDLTSGKGVNGAVLKLKNLSGSYSPSLQDVYRVLVDGDKLFTGFVAGYRDLWRRTWRFTEVKLVDLGFELFTLPVIKKQYESKTLNQIVADVLSDAYFVSDFHVATFTSQFDFLADNLRPIDAVKKICENEDVEWYFDAMGNLWIYSKGTQTSSLTVNDNNVLSVERSTDYMDLRNKVKVLGAKLASVPSDGDSWTESSVSGWGHTMDSCVLDSTDKKVGSKSIRAHEDATSVSEEVNYTLDNAISCLFADEPKVLQFWMKVDYVTAPGFWTLYLVNSNDSDYARKWFMEQLPDEEWAFYRFKLGPREGWEQTSGFKWTDIKKIRWVFTSGGLSEAFTVWIDGLCFADKPFVSEKSNSSSINSYGERNLLETAEELESQASVDSYADQLVKDRKDPQTEIQLLVQGANFKPGYTQTINLSSIGLSGTYRIARVTHYITRQWKTRLTLNKISPERWAEYVNRMHRMVRGTKLTKFVI